MAAQATLVLRDIHQPPAPPWWPPAPGWWLLAALVLAVLLVHAALELRRRRRRAAQAGAFDRATAAASTRPRQIAAMSELLRRAARQHDARTDTLEGEAWLAWLDGDDASRPFTAGPGRLLLDGGFRPDVDAAGVEALGAVARARFLQLLETRKKSARRRGLPGRSPAPEATPRATPAVDEAGPRTQPANAAGPPSAAVPRTADDRFRRPRPDAQDRNGSTRP